MRVFWLNRHFFQFLVTTILCSLTSACATTELLQTKDAVSDGRTSSVFNDGYPINKVGYIVYGQNAKGRRTFTELVFAQFFEYSRNVASELGELYFLNNGTVTVDSDTCYTNKNSVLRELWQGRWPLRAGSHISFSDDSGDLLNIDTTHGIVSPNDITYKPGHRVSKDLLGNLYVDIPGDDFPNFSDQKMPSLPSVKDLKTDNNFLDFTWTPSSTGGYLRFTFFITPDVKSKKFYVLGCNVVDDGSFSLTDTEHGSGSLDLREVHAVKTEVVRKNQSVLFLQRTQYFSLADFR